MTFFA